MKTINKILTFIFIFFILISNVNASTNTYPRTGSNDYGINKKWKITDDRINHALNVPYVDASEKVYDFADILTDEEEQALYKKINNFIKITGMDMVFISDDVPNTTLSENEVYATDFYDYNDFGIEHKHHDGIILYINTYASNRYYGVFAFGEMQLYLDDERKDIILDDMYHYMGVDYYSGVQVFVKKSLSLYEKGVVNKYEYIDENGFVQVKSSAKIMKALYIATPISFVATAIIIFILVSKNKMIRTAYNAGEYIVRNSISFSDKRDVFISTHTSSYTHSSSSGGGGGGGGSRSSSGSSGGGHSGGGRRF